MSKPNIDKITWLGRKHKEAKQGTPGPKVLTSVRLPLFLYHEAKASGNITHFIIQALNNQQYHSYLRTNYRREKVVDIMDQVASLYSASWLTPRIQASMFTSMRASILNPRAGLIISSL